MKQFKTSAELQAERIESEKQKAVKKAALPYKIIIFVLSIALIGTTMIKTLKVF